MLKENHIPTIDIMRGITLFLMIFVNDLYVKGVPHWLVHTNADDDGMGLADTVFPCFLFLVGISIPFAFSKRTKNGEPKSQILFHIFKRTLSLLLIGVLMVNIDRLNPELTGLNADIWVILVLISIFLFWNNYPKNKGYIYKILKYCGLISIVTIMAIFRAGTIDKPEWLTTSWWGILGLIGWGYFVSAMVFILVGENILKTSLAFLFFLTLNIFSQLNYLEFLGPLRPIFGVIINGNVPSIVLSGLLIGILLKRYHGNENQFLRKIIPIGILSIFIGLLLRNWFIISKIKATPSWSMICVGISILFLAFLYFIIDFKQSGKWLNVFKPAGENSLTTYLTPDIFYHLIWYLGLPFFFYKQDYSQTLAVFGSIAWAFVMIRLCNYLTKLSVKLKL